MLDAELNDTPTAKKIAQVLPFSTGYHTWGDEIYFTVPVESSLDESAQEDVTNLSVNGAPTAWKSSLRLRNEYVH